jgi:hypothetical protein
MKHREVFGPLFTIVILFSLVLSMPVSAQGYVYNAQWGGVGREIGKFRGPVGIAIASPGPGGAVVDVYLHVVDQDNNRIQKFDLGGGSPVAWGGYGTADGKFNSPTDVAADSWGNVYVADPRNRRIQKFDYRGTFQNKLISYRPASGFGYDLDYLSSVAVSGNVLIVGDSPVGANPSLKAFSINSDGTYTYKGGTIVAEDPSARFGNITDLAIDRSGSNLYVFDGARDRCCILQFAIEDGAIRRFIRKWGGPGSGNGQFLYPYGLAVDAAGNIYVADSGNNRIQKFDPNGRYLTKWGSRGSGNGQFQQPTDVAIDFDGNVYVADRYNNRIQKFNPILIEMVPPALTPIHR